MMYEYLEAKRTDLSRDAVDETSREGVTVVDKPHEGDAKSAVRTIQVLERLAERPVPQAPTLAELARDLEVPKSSLHVVVQTLIRRGWVERDDAGRLAIGVRAVRVATAFVDSDPVVALTGPVLDALVAELDETVHLGRLDGTDIVYLAKRESTQQLRLFSAVGRRLPAYTTALGKALLAGLPDDQLNDHLPARLEPLTDATITNRRRLRTQLAEIRERGWSSEEGENASGIACLAVTLPLAQPPADALSCSVPATRFGPERRQQMLAALMRARDTIAAAPSRR
jgi:DNA-binding IclR family transcriptional regulator